MSHPRKFNSSWIPLKTPSTATGRNTPPSFLSLFFFWWLKISGETKTRCDSTVSTVQPNGFSSDISRVSNPSLQPNPQEHQEPEAWTKVPVMAQGAKALEVPVDVDGCWMLGKECFSGGRKVFDIAYFICLFIYLFIYLFIHIFICLSICLFVRLFVCFYLFVCLFDLFLFLNLFLKFLRFFGWGSQNFLGESCRCWWPRFRSQEALSDYPANNEKGWREAEKQTYIYILCIYIYTYPDFFFGYFLPDFFVYLCCFW